MKRSIALWTLAFLITVSSAVYQRMTGPTYPFHTSAELHGKKIDIVLHRTHGGEGDHPVLVTTNDSLITGILEWRRYKTDDPFSSLPMEFRSGTLTGVLPHQPPAGKLEYRVVLNDGKRTVTDGTIIRFKGDVPTAVLIVHVLFMFSGMLLSTRAGLEYFAAVPSYRRITDTAFIVIAFGGMIMGPVVLHYAFNEWWTGFPFGSDITDNKTLVAFIAWCAAAIVVRRSAQPGKWILLAAIVTLAVFLIPHSLWGTELDYSTMKTN